MRSKIDIYVFITLFFSMQIKLIFVNWYKNALSYNGKGGVVVAIVYLLDSNTSYQPLLKVRFQHRRWVHVLLTAACDKVCMLFAICIYLLLPDLNLTVLK